MAIETVADIVRTHAAQRSGSAALLFEGRTVTYRELDERSNRLAQALLALGVEPGDRVGFLDKNTPQFFELAFALTKLGAVLVAANWRLAAGEIAQIVDDARVEVLFVGPEFATTVEKIEGALATVTTVVALGAHDRWLDYEELVSAQEPVDPAHSSSPEDVVAQLYTSGTTGLPKGVMITNESFFAGLDDMASSWGLDEDAVSLAVMPMFHIAGSGWALTGMARGCVNVLVREFDAAQVLDAIPRHRVTSALFVPAVIQALLSVPRVEEVDFSTLEVITYGASPITDTVLVRAMEVFGSRFIQLYGLTETTGAICQLEADEHDPERRPHLLRSCGRPYPGVELRAVDPESGEDVRTGEIGELWTRSRRNMAGYWANPEATARAITADGWFRTGDAGYLDADGYVFLHDRMKDMIVSGGENIYPAEVENVLAKHPSVADVAVIGVPDETWGEAVKAVCVRAPGATVTSDELIGFARGELAGFKLPKSVEFTDVLPRNPSGKLLKREIRAPYWEGRERQIN
jgi:long-chain acyl-CoA synthetase